MPSDFDELKEFERGEPEDENPRHYKAFNLQPRTQTLRISRANGIDDYQSYAYFIKCKGTRRAQTSFRIYFSFESVRVSGECLGVVIAAVGAKRCGEIIQFDKDTHDKPPKGEPIIHKIEFINYEEKKPLSATLKEEDDFLLSGRA